MRIYDEWEQAGPDYRIPLEMLMSKIRDTPEELLRERRDIKVQPAANIKIGGVLKTVTAPMPLIVFQDKSINFKMIGDFNASERRKTRSDKAASTVLGEFGGIQIEALSD